MAEAEVEHEIDLRIQLYEARDTTGDVTIKAKTRSFKAHLCVLSARSRVFATMLSSTMQEGLVKNVNLEHFDNAIVKNFIQYMYLGWTDGLQDDLSELLKLAHMYDISGLLAKCWRSKMETLSPETVVDLLLLAELYGGKEEQHKVSKFLLDKLYAVIKTENYSTLIKEHAELYLRICGTPRSGQDGGPDRKKAMKEFNLRDDPTASYLRIIVKEHGKKLWTLLVKPTDSIRNVKVKIYDASGISPGRQILFTSEISQLEDNFHVYDYNIENDSTIFVVA